MTGGKNEPSRKSSLDDLRVNVNQTRTKIYGLVVEAMASPVGKRSIFRLLVGAAFLMYPSPAW
jgi:hypothetical protein